MNKKPVHVVPSGGKWVVKREGSAAASSTHRKQSTAWEKGKSIARSQKSEAYLHGRDGRIRERNTYGNDPPTSKG